MVLYDSTSSVLDNRFNIVENQLLFPEPWPDLAWRRPYANGNFGGPPKKTRLHYKRRSKFVHVEAKCYKTKVYKNVFFRDLACEKFSIVVSKVIAEVTSFSIDMIDREFIIFIVERNLFLINDSFEKERSPSQTVTGSVKNKRRAVETFYWISFQPFQ